MNCSNPVIMPFYVFIYLVLFCWLVMQQTLHKYDDTEFLEDRKKKVLIHDRFEHINHWRDWDKPSWVELCCRCFISVSPEFVLIHCSSVNVHLLIQSSHLNICVSLCSCWIQSLVTCLSAAAPIGCYHDDTAAAALMTSSSSLYFLSLGLSRI